MRLILLSLLLLAGCIEINQYGDHSTVDAPKVEVSPTVPISAIP